MDGYANVTVVRKANVYYGGNVTSRTIFMADGSRKTLGLILPGKYEFTTADREHMEILDGALDVLLPGSAVWESFTAGQTFDIPANSKFTASAARVTDYCCSYIAD